MIPTLKDWTTGTSVFGRFRSEELKSVDRAITDYQADRNENTRKVVGTAWDFWKYVHVSDFKKLSANKRNSKNLFSLLDAEFNSDGTKIPKVGAISSWKMQFPDERPIGFANVDEDTMRKRIDMAIVDAQSVLQIVNERLRKADSDTQAQVRIWFGDTPLATVRDRFAKLGEKARSGFKSTTSLEVRWTSVVGTTAATGHGASWMEFGSPFFDDNITLSGIKLKGRPAAPQSHINELREIAASIAGPKEKQELYMQVTQ